MFNLTSCLVLYFKYSSSDNGQAKMGVPEPASMGIPEPVCVGVLEPVSTGAPGQVSVGIPGPVSVDIPAIMWMTEKIICSTIIRNNNNNSNNDNCKAIIIIEILIIKIIIIVIRIAIIIVLILEIKIEILQGVSLGMGSLHIKVFGSWIEGRDYNNSIQKYYCVIRSTPGPI